MIKKSARACFAISVLLVLLKACAAADFTIECASFVDSNALDVATALAELGGLDIFVSSQGGGNVEKRVTLNIKNTSCLDAVGRVLSMAGLKHRIDGKTVLVSALPQDILSSADLKDVDSETRQVLINTKVVEISENGMREMGIKWGREAGVVKFVIDKDTGRMKLTEDILAVVKALESDGRAEILAEPSIVTLNEHEAFINIGSRIPYAVPASTASSTVSWTVQYIDAGVSLKIKPEISDDGYISVLLKPEVSSISEWRGTSAGEFPVITTRNAETEVRVKNGETIVIGGLINKSDRENLARIPYLGDIPVVGLMFQNRVRESARTEVIFLITPQVI